MGFSIEQAEVILNDNKDLPLDFRSYLIAIVESKLPQYFLAKLIHYRDGYFDDLPTVDVRQLIQTEDKSKFIQYKCQRNYTTRLASILRGCLIDGVIENPSVQQAVEDFLDSDLDFEVGDSENPQRIDRINSILNMTISYIECQIGIEE